jgi:hypothetical protein
VDLKPLTPDEVEAIRQHYERQNDTNKLFDTFTDPVRMAALAYSIAVAIGVSILLGLTTLVR